MLELQGAIWFRSGSQDWGGKDRIALLAAIGAHGSITAAARAVGISYKAAWDAIDAMNNSAGEPLVVRAAGGKGGGGTRLTARGEQLIRTYRALEDEHRRFVAQLSRLGEGVADDIHLMRRMMIKTSARNKLFGRVASVKGGAVNDEVELELAGGQRIVATITHESVETLELAEGVEAFALIKASSVLVGLPEPGLRLSARNQLPGVVARVMPGAVNAEVVIELDGGGTVAAIVTNGSVEALGLQAGVAAVAIFKASSVILGVVG
ncbi:transcriptional repressor for molybdate uptake [Cupriavidus phytorum]|uniref:Transcriptional repressor for molybdate uptake n=2 Tax=Cupriavidus TaxID=106589 RepID=A0A375BBW7_9BURK|nr:MULTISPECIES: TOBE domain-containing protein [Cupriavidus]PZX30589.1 molybdate transport system regulatory protein [Cupriavidus alkaliphilus]SOY41110.1 transcriptional repressor for molybdate uptake [Cupriavidus taiwanensis]